MRAQPIVFVLTKIFLVAFLVAGAAICIAQTSVASHGTSRIDSLPSRQQLYRIVVREYREAYQVLVELADPAFERLGLFGKTAVVKLSGVANFAEVSRLSESDRRDFESELSAYFGSKVVGREMYLELPGRIVTALGAEGPPENTTLQLSGFLWFSVPSRFVQSVMTEVSTLCFNFYLVRFGFAGFQGDEDVEKYSQEFKEGERDAEREGLGFWRFIRKAKTNALSGTHIESGVRIVALKYDGKNEYVLIRNEGATPVDLRGWTLESAIGGQKYTFPRVVLPTGGELSVHSGEEASGPIVWTKKYIWRNEGDEAILRDNSGKIVSRYRYP